MKESIVMVASYGGPYGGNFIPSLIAYDEVVKNLGYRTVYVFPDFVETYDWVKEMRAVADVLYFIPYNQYSWDNVKRIRKICKSENAKLIYSRMSGWDLTARFAMPKLPMIWHMELGLNLSSPKVKFKYWMKYRFFGGKHTYHMAVSEATAQVINSLGVKNKCEWIPNAINLTRLKRKDSYSYAVPMKLLSFAYLPEIKGFDIALDACEILNRETTRYILMGSAQKPTYEYIEKRYGNAVPEWLKLIPPTDKISDLFDEADILLCPSRSEGLSFANLEGMYSGLPVVYSSIPGNQLLSGFEMTYPFQTCDSADLAKMIETCVSHPISEKEQQQNRSIIENDYTMPAWSGRISTFIQKIIERKQ